MRRLGEVASKTCFGQLVVMLAALGSSRCTANPTLTQHFGRAVVGCRRCHHTAGPPTFNNCGVGWR
eukprot:11549395-Alexandrium_andersonii.AAC.1